MIHCQPFGEVVDDNLWPEMKAIIKREIGPIARPRHVFIKSLRAQQIANLLEPLHGRLITHFREAHPTALGSTWPTLFEFYMLPSVQAYLRVNDNPDTQKTRAVRLATRMPGQAELVVVESDTISAQRLLESQLLRLICNPSQPVNARAVDLIKADTWVTLQGMVHSVPECLNLPDLRMERVYCSSQGSFIPEVAPDLAGVHLDPHRYSQDIPIVRDITRIKRSPQACSHARKLMKMLEDSGMRVPATLEEADQLTSQFVCRANAASRGQRHCGKGGRPMDFCEAVGWVSTTLYISS